MVQLGFGMEEYTSEKGTLRMAQKEKERERRRMRDRQRRQSMSAEERAQHLARRRRNYQLRRQRAENARLVPQFEEGTIQDQHEPLIEDIIVSDDQGHDVKTEVGWKLPPHILAMLPRRPRLTHFKHLARSLNDQVGEDDHRLHVEVFVKDGESNCGSAKALRLNSIKRLARGIYTTVTESADQNHQSEGEQNLKCGENQLKSCEVLQGVQPNSLGVENNQLS
ncbi:hypothetical protein HS088_TW21G01002 [Tripterygium wilfordii]|uniref:Uncharacterized protein n=1 Tax=Tripterygium wilfordii TaxID=458696 RepID=A0A7J7C420_TRIWF|nr:uncharacterized protein LOC119989430 [Tripterygium wilfordii]XP_038690867.1 uncharacterized protein LOC119989430 [Tripterygium wilfordii]KAF5728848.1 hypothetical protein HS088_TW21G01002 [Tripterygium wilfordii]